MPYLNTIWAVLWTELKLRLRSRNLIAQLLGLVALCALLVPPPAATYTIIAVGGLKPDMTASTALIACSVVLSALAIFVFGLALDVGTRRDSIVGVRSVVLTQPIDIRWLLAGRFLAAILFAALIVTVAAAILSTTLYARYLAFPSSSAFMLFGSMVLPALVVAAVIGAVTDMAFPTGPWKRVLVVFGAWSALTVSSLTSAFDVLSVGSLRALINVPRAETELALGLIKVTSAQSFKWQDIPPVVDQIVSQRVTLAAVFILAGVVLIFAVGHLVWPAFDFRKAAPRRAIAERSSFRPTSQTPLRQIPSSAVTRPPGASSPLETLWLIALRMLKGSLLALLLLGSAIVISGLRVSGPATALALIYVVPFLAFTRTRQTDVRVGHSIELVEPALLRPTAGVLHTLALTMPMLISSLPALVQLPPVQALTAALGMFSIAGWLGWTHERSNAPTLGVATAGLVLYATAFNDIPAEADVLGLSHASFTALFGGIIIATFVAGILLRSPRR